MSWNSFFFLFISWIKTHQTTRPLSPQLHCFIQQKGLLTHTIFFFNKKNKRFHPPQKSHLVSRLCSREVVGFSGWILRGRRGVGSPQSPRRPALTSESLGSFVVFRGLNLRNQRLVSWLPLANMWRTGGVHVKIIRLIENYELMNVDECWWFFCWIFF